MRRIGLLKGEGPCRGRRAAALAIITWIPLLALSAIEGRAIGPTPRESFLFDFGAYAHFLVAIPLFFAAEAAAAKRLSEAGLHIITVGLVDPADAPALHAAVARNQHLRESFLPELVILAIAVLGLSAPTLGLLPTNTALSWHTVNIGGRAHLSWAGVWYRFVSLPIFQFVLLWWLWRIAVWTRYLWDISRLRLRLMPAHADHAGGLGILADAHAPLALFVFAAGWVPSANAAFQVCFAGAQIGAYKAVMAAYLVLGALVCFGPLLVFVPALVRARWSGIQEYDRLAKTYARSFDDKWLHGGAQEEGLLGSPDIQSLADMANSYKVVDDMRPLPFGVRDVALFIVIALLPWVPLILLVIPLRDVMGALSRVLLF